MPINAHEKNKINYDQLLEQWKGEIVTNYPKSSRSYNTTQIMNLEDGLVILQWNIRSVNANYFNQIKFISDEKTYIIFLLD